MDMYTDMGEERPRVFMSRPDRSQFVLVPTRKELINTADRGKSLQSVVSIIKNFGQEYAVVITDEHLARATGTTTPKLRACLNGEALPSKRLFSRLVSAYAYLLDAIRRQYNLQSLQQSVLWIRNLGFSRRMNITLKDMAGKAGITVDQLKAYLRNEQVGPAGLSAWLELAYEPLLEDVDSVEILEDLETILGGE